MQHGIGHAARRTSIVAIAVLAMVLVGRPARAQDVESRPFWRDAATVLTLRQPVGATGLTGSVLRIERRGRLHDVPLDGTATGRRARQVDAVYPLPGGRVVLHVDRLHQPSGLIVIDLEAGRVVDAVVGRDLTPSADRRFWLFEEHAIPFVDVWPNTETVYALYDAAAPEGSQTRACGAADDRCRGLVLHLPDRQALCQAIATQRAGTCFEPGREPRHARRSPFVWLSAAEAAWVDVDRARETATLVVASIDVAGHARTRAVPIERERTVGGEPVPPVREAWSIDRITRDADPSRLWLHFRTRVAQVPSQRLAVRLE